MTRRGEVGRMNAVTPPAARVRAEILAETIARLEAERYAPRPLTAVPKPPRPAPRRDVREWAERLPAEPDAEQHRQVLADALGGDLYVVAHNERSAS